MNRESNCDIAVGECLAKIARQPKVKTTDYLESGAFPVIDQGMKFVGGYVNDESLLYTGPLPVVIFGDHNRHIKFVKSPFAVGADGTQLLYPDERFDISYFYYAIRALPLKNYGYERHFKYLKEERLRVWPLDGQRRIAAILAAYDDLIENNTRRIEILEEMARRIYEEWFVRFRFPGHEGMRMVESELGLVPAEWRVTRFTDVFDVRYGKGLGTRDLLADGQYPVYGAGGVIGRYDSFIAEGPTCLITSRGNGSGTVWRTVEKAFVTNNSFLVYPKADFTGLNFGFAELFAGQANVKTVVSGSAQPQLTLDGLAGLQVIAPERAVLVRFDALVSPMFDLANKLHFVVCNLRTTRDLLLPKLISGELSVTEMFEPEALAA